MKKFLCPAVVLFIAVMVSLVYADAIPPHFKVVNAYKFAGGNDAVYIREFDFTNMTFDNSLEHEKNDDAYLITILAQKWSDKPAPKNTRPTKKYGLLNPSDPIEITAFGSKVIFPRAGWGGDYVDAMRLLDDKGKELFKWSLSDKDRSDFELTVKSIPANYYVELVDETTVFSHTPSIGIGPFSVPIGNGISAKKSSYCYVLLKIVSGRERRDFNEAEAFRNDVIEMGKQMILNRAIMRKYNLTDGAQLSSLTPDQLISAMKEYNDKDTPDYDIAKSVVENYAKDHNITNPKQFKDSDYDAMLDEYNTRLNMNGRAPVRAAPARKTRTK